MYSWQLILIPTTIWNLSGLKQMSICMHWQIILNLKQNCINNCNSIYPCIKSPITLIQGTTSYICDNNIPENNTCKITKQTLYPYGYYLCKNNVCNTCVNEAAEL